jgi:hypothetical protein
MVSYPILLILAILLQGRIIISRSRNDNYFKNVMDMIDLVVFVVLGFFLLRLVLNG